MTHEGGRSTPEPRGQPPGPSSGQPWHLDKSVPIGLIAAILLQTAAAIWWSATISARVDSLEAVALDNKTTGPRLAVLESQLADIKAALLRIEARISTPGYP
jgi:hypothetical protein